MHFSAMNSWICRGRSTNLPGWTPEPHCCHTPSSLSGSSPLSSARRAQVWSLSGGHPNDPSAQDCQHRALFLAWLHPTPSQGTVLQHYSSCPLSWSHTWLLLGKEQDLFQASKGSSSDAIRCREPFHYSCLASLKAAPLIS